MEFTVRVLVTGAGGLVGGRLAELLQIDGFAVVGGRHVARLPPGIRETTLDLLDPGSVGHAIADARPDAVLHAAALAQVDACESRPDEAAALNHRATASLARTCRAAGLRLVALSTDFVFEGNRAFVTEEDPARPILTYGRTKLAGEEALLAAHPDAAVIRIALVIGRGHGPRGTASEAIAWALRAGRHLRLFTDEYRTPIDPESIARAVGAVLRGETRGRFHLGGSERISAHELGLRVARTLSLSTEGLAAARQGDHCAAAPRPHDVSFSTARARDLLAWRPRPLEEALHDGRVAPSSDVDKLPARVLRRHGQTTATRNTS